MTYCASSLWNNCKWWHRIFLFIHIWSEVNKIHLFDKEKWANAVFWLIFIVLQYCVVDSQGFDAKSGKWVTGQLADTPTRGLPTRGLDKSRTGQLAVSQMQPKERKLSRQSRRWHPRVVQSATCPVRELSSPRVGQSARCPVRESSSPRVGNRRVGVSASCPVTGKCMGPGKLY